VQVKRQAAGFAPQSQSRLLGGDSGPIRPEPQAIGADRPAAAFAGDGVMKFDHGDVLRPAFKTRGRVDIEA